MVSSSWCLSSIIFYPLGFTHLPGPSLISLLDRVGNYRYHVYSIFLVVPNGLLRALASKKVTIEGEGEDDDDDEQPAAASGATPQQAVVTPKLGQLPGGTSSRWSKAVGALKGNGQVGQTSVTCDQCDV